ncbi:hypothetical protein [Pseudoxanthomonas sacheonensis]|uniref:Uncharacterized protein n=1 Tax=Pseudoxanthomonas sacheonensis TaxID=443615 RepID=A0ABU1RR60_9GAMM|nr:hypothetical protein [Pseudoxanthomonas sacheonensis]MDR6841255.1 hypothetical protein [Pseudoxanthomonas sacheonensis]
MNPPAPNRRLLRWTVRLSLVLVLAYALYLIAGNLFLNTSLGHSAVNRKPEKFQMQWASGSTWWPGRVSLSEVKLRGHVRHTQWSIQAARASGRIGLLALLRREVHVPYVWVTDVTGAVDRTDAEQPAPAPGEGGWTLRFDRITSDSVRRGSFGTLSLEGKGSAEFAFVKQLRGGPMQVLSSTAKFTDARLTQEGQEWLRDGKLDLRFAIARHIRAQAQGLQKLRLSDIELDLQGTTAAMAVALDANGQGSFKTVPGQGQAKARLKFSRGALAPGSQLRWQMPLLSTDPKGAIHTDHVQLALQVDRDMMLTAYMPPQAGGAFGLDADLRIAGNQVPLKDFGSLLPRTSGHVAGQWRFSSLRWLGRFFTKAPWLTLDGAGDVAADVQVANGKVAAGSTFSVPQVAVVAEVMSNRIEGSGRAEGRFDAGANGGLLPTLNIVLSRFHVAANDNLSAPYVQGSDLHLDVAAGEDLALLRDSLRAHLTFKGARIPDLRVYNRYLPSQHLRFDGGSGVLSGDLHLDAKGDIGRGWIRLAGRKARMRVAGIALRGDIGIDTRLRRADLVNRNFAVDGSAIALDNISFSEPGGETRSGWWARIDLPRARMDWNKPLSVGGNASVKMKDVGFLLSLFSRRKEYPKWVFKLVDAGQAQVQGRVQWQRDTLVLDRIDASNDRFDLQARLRLRGQNRHGSLYAKWGMLSVGVQADGAQNQFHLLRAKQWYDAQPQLLP